MTSPPRSQPEGRDDLLERLDDQGLYNKAERIQMIKDAAAEIRRLRGHGECGVQCGDALSDAVAALKAVQKIIAEGAMTGFNCHDGDWAERLFHSQQATSAAIKKASPMSSADRGRE